MNISVHTHSVTWSKGGSRSEEGRKKRGEFNNTIVDFNKIEHPTQFTRLTLFAWSKEFNVFFQHMENSHICLSIEIQFKCRVAETNKLIKNVVS
jgi:hypothetical protein